MGKKDIEKEEIDKFDKIEEDLKNKPGQFGKDNKQKIQQFKKETGNTELATIKKAGEKEILTPEEFKARARELKKCRKDILYFCRKYFKIVSLKDGLINLNPYPRQEELLKFMQNNNRCVCCASRQTGKCVQPSTKITIRNKITGEENTLTIGEFFEKIKNNSKCILEQAKKENEVITDVEGKDMS